MDNDFLALDPLETDQDLIENLIRFSEEHQLLIENEKEQLIKERIDLSKNRLNRFIEETNKNVMNVSCPVNDHPQQYQLNQQQHQQYQLSQQNNLYDVNQSVQNPVIQPVNNIQYQIYQLNNNCSQQQIYSDDGYKINLNPVYVKPYYLDQNSVLIYPQANVNPFFRIVSTKSDADCQLMEPPIIQRSNAVIQNSIENFQVNSSCSNENIFNNHENNLSNLVRTPLSEIQNKSEFNEFDEFIEQELIDPNRCQEIIYHQQNTTDKSIDLIKPNAKRTKSTKCSSKKKLKRNSNDDESQQESIDIPEAFKRLPANLAQYFKDDQNLINSKESTSSQEELERTVLNDSEFIKMYNYSKMVCSQIRYSAQRIKYLNHMEKLTYNEADRKMDGKEMSNQFKRIQLKNKKVKKAKFKNRSTMNIGLKDLYYEASKLNIQERVESVKQLILNLESKMICLSKRIE